MKGTWFSFWWQSLIDVYYIIIVSIKCIISAKLIQFPHSVWNFKEYIYLWSKGTHPLESNRNGDNPLKFVVWARNHLNSPNRKRHIEKESYRPILLMNREAKILHEMLVNRILEYLKQITHLRQGCFNTQKSINQIHHSNKTKTKSLWSSQ